MESPFNALITLTLLPVNDKGSLENISVKKHNQTAVKVWKTFFDSNQSHPFSCYYKRDEGGSISDVLDPDITVEKLADLNVTPEDLANVMVSRKTNDWPYYHSESLVISTILTNFVYQLDIEHRTTSRKFRRFYYDGKARFCESPTETFDKKLLI